MRFFLLLILLWITTSQLVDLNTVFLPDIVGVIKAYASEFNNGALLSNLGATFIRVFIGLFVGVAFGLCIGVWLGNSYKFRKFFMPAVDFLRGIPTSMLFPVFIVAFGIGELSKIIIVATATFPIMVVSTITGFVPRKEVQDRTDYINLHHETLPLTIILFAMIWNALPSIISGLKVSISIALVLTIVTEMFFVASSGVGWAAHQSYQSFELDKMYAYIILVGMIGLMINYLFDRVIKSLNEYLGA